LSIIDFIVYGIGTLPEAKIGPVKGMPKRGKDSCRLHVLAFNYLDLLFCPLVKLVDQGVNQALMIGLELLLSESDNSCTNFFGAIWSKNRLSDSRRL
jgi:hypothetical protein